MKWMVNIVRSLPVMVGCLCSAIAYGQSEVVLENQALSIRWQQTPAGYKLAEIKLTPAGQVLSIDHTEGRYTNLFSTEKPGTTIDSSLFDAAQGHLFDEYKYIQ